MLAESYGLSHLWVDGPIGVQLAEDLRAMKALPSATPLRGWPLHVILAVHSALDNLLGDSDLGHLVNEQDIQNHCPVQWAATELAKLIAATESKATRNGADRNALDNSASTRNSR
jgi:hypothetical protein